MTMFDHVQHLHYRYICPQKICANTLKKDSLKYKCYKTCLIHPFLLRKKNHHMDYFSLHLLNVNICKNTHYIVDNATSYMASHWYNNSSFLPCCKPFLNSIVNSF